MKKSLITVVALALAISAFGQIGRYSVGLGPMNTASNSNYATTTGYFAGYEGVALTRTSLFGSLAGQNAHYTQRSVGIGYGALYMATNCNDCVAIGDRAGAKWRNATGWVDVGGAFVYTNGYLDIKAPTRGYNIGGVLKDTYGEPGIYHGEDLVATFGSQTTHIVGGLEIVEKEGTGGYVNASTVTANELYGYSIVGTDKLRLATQGPTPCELTFDGTNICVHVGDTLLGYLTITPPAQGQ